MVIIGIDPGYERCGFAILSHERGVKEILLESACVLTDKHALFSQRLLTVGNRFKEYIVQFKPTYCAIEKVYFTSNQKTAMHVAEVRGMVLYLATYHNIPIREYTPNEIKVAIAGDGRADKKQVTYMIPRLISIKKDIRYDDEYDAIAVALTASATMSSHHEQDTKTT